MKLLRRVKFSLSTPSTKRGESDEPEAVDYFLIVTMSEDASSFKIEEVALSNGGTFGMPAEAIPSIRDVIIKIKEHQLSEDETFADEWSKWGHRIGNVASQLVYAAMTQNAGAQQRRLEELTREIIALKGDEVKPLLAAMGFPKI